MSKFQSYAVATHEINGEPYGPSPAGVLLRALRILETIRREGYKPHGAGTIAISERIEELEEAIEGTGNRRPLDGMRMKGSG